MIANHNPSPERAPLPPQPLSGSPPVAGWSITVKLTLVLLLVALLPMTAIAYYNLRASLESVARSEQQELKNLAVSTAGRLDQLVIGFARVVKYVVTTPAIVDFLSRPGDDLTEVNAFLARLKDASPDIANVYLTDLNGVFVAATDPSDVGNNYRFRDYFRVAREGHPYVSDILVGTTTGDAGVFFSQPVRDTKGRIVGVAVVKVEAQVILEGLRQVDKTDDDVQAFLVNADGIIIAHPRDGLLYHSLGQLSTQRIEEIQEHSRYPVGTIASLGLDSVARAVLGAQAPGYLRFTGPIDGAPHVLGFAPLHAKDWSVGISEPEAVFAAPLTRLFHQGMASVLAMGGLVILLSLYLGRQLVGPLRSLTEVTRCLSSGICATDRAARAAGPGPLAGTHDDVSSEALAAPAPTATSTGARPWTHSQAHADGTTGFTLQVEVKGQLLNIAQTYRDEIGELAHTFEQMLEQLEVYIRDLETVTAAKASIESEMKLAAAIQQSLLPPSDTLRGVSEELDLAVFIQPAKDVGGDLYDFFLIDPDHVFFVIGDVSDKGMPAALFMGMTLALLRNLVKPGKAPGDIFAELNQALSRNNDTCQFVTLFGGILALRTGEVTFANGGHNPPYRRVAASGRFERIDHGGVAVGCFEQVSFETHHLRLAPGDVLFTYTDGVTEGTDPAEALYGEDRLRGCLAGSTEHEPAAGLVTRVVEDLRGFVDQAPQADDITILCLRYRGPHPGDA